MKENRLHVGFGSERQVGSALASRPASLGLPTLLWRDTDHCPFDRTESAAGRRR